MTFLTIRDLFSPSGKLNQMQYLVITLVTELICNIELLMWELEGYSPDIILLIFTLFVCIISIIKRLRDMNKSGYWIIPMIGVGFLSAHILTLLTFLLCLSPSNYSDFDYDQYLNSNEENPTSLQM